MIVKLNVKKYIYIMVFYADANGRNNRNIFKLE
jgi:hypothetical protein